MKVFRHKDKREAAERAGKELNRILRGAKKESVLLLLSGGSALDLRDGIPIESLGNHVTISVLDERFSKDPNASNFAQLARTEFYRQAKEKGTKFIDTRVGEGESLEGLAERFEKSLREWKERNPEGKVIITQGIGEDGHTAGIMPYPDDPGLFKKLFDDPKKWVVGYDAGGRNEHPLRATVTLSFLREVVDHSIVYAVGENKREALTQVLSEQGTLWQTPARIIHEMKDVMIFTDADFQVSMEL